MSRVFLECGDLPIGFAKKRVPDPGALQGTMFRGAVLPARPRPLLPPSASCPLRPILHRLGPRSWGLGLPQPRLYPAQLQPAQRRLAEACRAAQPEGNPSPSAWTGAAAGSPSRLSALLTVLPAVAQRSVHTVAFLLLLVRLAPIWGLGLAAARCSTSTAFPAHWACQQERSKPQRHAGRQDCNALATWSTLVADCSLSDL